MQTALTKHDLDRVLNRLTLDPDEVINILDTGKSLPVGKESGSERVHRLFFSEADNTWFVAVQDEKTAEVVTVIPLGPYHRFTIPYETLDKAKHLIVAKPVSKAAPVTTLQRTSKVYKFTAYFEHRESGKRRLFNLGSVPSENWDSISQMQKDASVQSLIKEKIKNALLVGEYCTGVIVRHGKDGEIISFDME